jgi:hypothetical protein
MKKVKNLNNFFEDFARIFQKYYKNISPKVVKK